MCAAERHGAAIFCTTNLWGVCRCRRSSALEEITISEINMTVSERHLAADHLPWGCYGTHFSMDKQTRCKGDLFLRLLPAPLTSVISFWNPNTIRFHRASKMAKFLEGISQCNKFTGECQLVFTQPQSRVLLWNCPLSLFLFPSLSRECLPGFTAYLPCCLSFKLY